MNARVRIIGCGRWSMGDDQVGLLVAEQMRAFGDRGMDVWTTEEPIIELADESGSNCDLLVVVDAAPADEQHPVGAWARIDFTGQTKFRLPNRPVGVHALGVAEALEVAARLGRLPPIVRVYVIFGQDFERSLTPSVGVRDAVPAFVTYLRDEIRVFRVAATSRSAADRPC